VAVIVVEDPIGVVIIGVVIVSVARLRNDSVAVAIPRTIFEVDEATLGVAVGGIDPLGVIGVDHQVRIVQVPQEDIEGNLRMVEATVGAAALGLDPRGVTDPEVLQEAATTNETGVALMIVVGAQTTTVYRGAVPIGK
jgi:hypothetical protein